MGVVQSVPQPPVSQTAVTSMSGNKAAVSRLSETPTAQTKVPRLATSDRTTVSPRYSEHWLLTAGQLECVLSNSSADSVVVTLCCY